MSTLESWRRPPTTLLDAAQRIRYGSSVFCFDPHMTFLPPDPPELVGSEPFAGVDASVIDFWRFAMSDLRTNNVRGYLAEFLVAKAVGAEARRVEWDAWDVTAPNGTRIEVKSSGYLQAWAQPKLSNPVFRVAPAYAWDGSTGSSSTTQGFNADVYVFCLHTAKTHEEYDPLDVSQWQFYVASRPLIEARTGSQMSLSTLERLCGAPISYESLGMAISVAAN